MTITAALAYLIIPALIIILAQKLPLLDKAGVVVLSFATGIVASALASGHSDWSALAGIRTTLSEVSIALALPLLVFSIDVKASFSMAGDTMKSMALALISVLLVSAIGAFFYADTLTDVWQIAGMSVGAYTGGGPNMAAIKTAIEAAETVFTTMITYDILLSALYLLFVMSLAKPVFSRVLRPFKSQGEHAYHTEEDAFGHMADDTANAYKVLAQGKSLLQAFAGLLLSGVIVGLSLAIASLAPEAMRSAVTIITITTLGVMASFVPRIRQLKGTFQLGMYLILVFCLTTGSMTDTGIITNLNMDLFAYIGLILVGSLVLQALLCRVLNIDTDTFLITSSAAIMSVPFIPVIAGALKNREIILPGFAAAIIGYIIGNYLGIAVAYGTRAMLSAG